MPRLCGLALLRSGLVGLGVDYVAGVNCGVAQIAGICISRGGQTCTTRNALELLIRELILILHVDRLSSFVLLSHDDVLAIKRESVTRIQRTIQRILEVNLQKASDSSEVFLRLLQQYERDFQHLTERPVSFC